MKWWASQYPKIFTIQYYADAFKKLNILQFHVILKVCGDCSTFSSFKMYTFVGRSKEQFLFLDTKPSPVFTSMKSIFLFSYKKNTISCSSGFLIVGLSDHNGSKSPDISRVVSARITRYNWSVRNENCRQKNTPRHIIDHE